jgi:hypothetical protein
MAIEIGKKKPRPIDFTFNGKPLAVRKLPLRLGLKMNAFAGENSLPAELVAEIISHCVVSKDGKSVWNTEEVLDFDLDTMLKLFSEVSGEATGIEDAEKN